MSAPSRRVVLIGHPLSHSLSPAFQNAAFRAAGIDARYDLADLAPEALPGALARLRADEMLGANVTVPYKREVIPALDDLSDDARALGAVNTIVNRVGALVGMNTDVPGFSAALKEAGIPVAGRSIVLLGAGGAARAVVAALRQMDAAHLLIANRTPAHADALMQQWPASWIDTTSLDSPRVRDALPRVHLLVNATSVGLHGDALPLPEDFLSLLPADAAVYDLIYRPTALLRAARRRNLRAVDGLGMLVHQGALAWEAWTGRGAPLEVMWQAARAAQAERA